METAFLGVNIMNEICETLKFRFLLLEKITSYKFIHNLPLSDREREKLMLTEVAAKAKSMNICEKSVMQFFSTLVTLSKKMQSNIMCRYYYDTKFTVNNTANIADVRKEIDHLNFKLLEDIKNFYEKKSEVMPENFILFCDNFDVPHLSIMEKKQLFDELQKVKLN